AGRRGRRGGLFSRRLLHLQLGLLRGRRRLVRAAGVGRGRGVGLRLGGGRRAAGVAGRGLAPFGCVLVVLGRHVGGLLRLLGALGDVPAPDVGPQLLPEGEAHLVGQLARVGAAERGVAEDRALAAV